MDFEVLNFIPDNFINSEKKWGIFSLVFLLLFYGYIVLENIH